MQRGPLISLKWAGGARPFQDFYCVKNAWRRFAAARRCRADNPRRRKVRLSQLSPFWRKLRPLPCSSSSHCDRSAGSQREPLGKTFPPIRSVGEWGAYSLIGLSNGLYLAVLSLPFGEKWGWCRVRQFLKHQVHAEVVLVWLIIVRYVSYLG